MYIFKTSQGIPSHDQVTFTFRQGCFLPSFPPFLAARLYEGRRTTELNSRLRNKVSAQLTVEPRSSAHLRPDATLVLDLVIAALQCVSIFLTAPRAEPPPSPRASTFTEDRETSILVSRPSRHAKEFALHRCDARKNRSMAFQRVLDTRYIYLRADGTRHFNYLLQGSKLASSASGRV